MLERNLPKSMTRFVLLASVTLISIVSVCASGSYVPRPPRKLAKADRTGVAIDPERYGLGRAVVLRTGEVRLPTTIDEGLKGPQAERLRGVEAALPAEVRDKAQLGALAGRLTAAELEAVIYYLSVRFPAP